MNDLLSPSNSRSRSRDEQSFNGGGGDVQTMASSMNNFFKDVEVVKEELEVIEKLYKTLQDAHEETKSLHNSKSIKTLRTKMDSYVSQALTKAKSIKYHLQSLEQSNALNRTVPGCGPGTSSDRTRTSLINGLKKKLKDSMEKFNSLREKISLDYKETIERRYFMVTGEKADDQTVEKLISSGDSEDFMKRVISEQGRGNVLDTISEIQERHEAVKEIEKSLMELHQVFLDMSVMVEVQGEQLDDIESQVGRASSFVRDGNQKLQKAKFYQKNTRKWTCFAIILLIIIILVILLPIILNNKKK